MTFTPLPPVSSAATRALVALNGALLSIGSVYFAVVVLGALLLLLSWATSDCTRAMLRFADVTTRRDRLRVFLPTATITFLGVAIGLADAASSAASSPVTAVLARAGVGSHGRLVVQHRDYVLNNHGGLSSDTVDDFIRSSNGTLTPGTLTPLRFALGTISYPQGNLIAPSSAIVTVPARVLPPELTGDIDAPCDRSVPVIVGDQARLGVGALIDIDGRRAVVAGFDSQLAGLGRLLVLGSNEQLGRCAFPEKAYTLVAGPADEAGSLMRAVTRNGGQAELTDARQLVEVYDDFWQGTVAPPEMNLFLQILLVAVLGSIYTSRTRSLQLQELRASLSARGVPVRVIGRASLLCLIRDALLAALLAIVPFSLLTAATNSTQFGIALPVGVSGLGAGLLAGHAAMLLGHLLGERPVARRLDLAGELRKAI
ncbi:MAG: hypothetical protein HYR89_00470 [Actinobacteria bacterium]|nr:hypothetical protein [Actinomycetota bacterium]